jgi:NADH-quinone oxidoreductase subunit A
MVLVLIAIFLFLCAWPGERKASPEKATPYECGIIPTGFARFRYPVPFYRVAVFFLIFDVEAAYIFAWAVAFEPLGWAGWVRISFFILMLLLGLFYLWSKGELDWRIETSRPPKT